MKINSMVKILVMLIIIIIILSIGLVATTIKLTTMGKSIANQDTPIVVDKGSEDIVEKLEEKPVEEKLEEKIDEPVKEPSVEEIIDNKPSKEDKTNNEKSNNKDKPEKNKPNKDKSEKDKQNKDKPNKDKPNKDKPNKENKKDKKDNKKDKPKEEKEMVKSKYISKDEATKIGLNKVGDGAELIKIKSDFDGNPPKYNLKIVLGNYEYEIEIHGITGAVIDFEKDEIDN